VIFDWGVIIQLMAIVVTGVGTYAAIRADLAVLHANLLNHKDDIEELQKDVKRHDRIISALDRRHISDT